MLSGNPDKRTVLGTMLKLSSRMTFSWVEIIFFRRFDNGFSTPRSCEKTVVTPASRSSIHIKSRRCTFGFSNSVKIKLLLLRAPHLRYLQFLSGFILQVFIKRHQLIDRTIRSKLNDPVGNGLHEGMVMGTY
jgi:hypothetical protein